MKDFIIGLIGHPVTGTVLLGALGLFGAVAQKYRKLAKEVLDVIQTTIKARGKNSPGGKSFTDEELQAIGKEIVEAFAEGATLLNKK